VSNFEPIWQRIRGLRGETFYTKTGKPFSYDVSGDAVLLRNTNRMLGRSQFAEAFARMPVTGPGQLQDLQGPSYVYAILTDRRVSAG
jgi:hypothetical protein